MQHLGNGTVQKIINQQLPLDALTNLYLHWRRCPTCQRKLRRGLATSALTRINNPQNSTVLSLRWMEHPPRRVLFTTDHELLAIALTAAEYRNYIRRLRKLGLTVRDLGDTEKPRGAIVQALHDFLRAGTPLKPNRINLLLMETLFGREVLFWTSLIPYGQTASYGEVANWMDRPGAARAVGGALHRNPLPFIIPCHRVIGAGGALIGFGGGLPMKRKLLELESRNLQIIALDETHC